MTIQFVEEARDEFLDAISHYEEVRADLGRRFKEEVDRSILWVADHPELYRLRPSGYRRVKSADFSLLHSLRIPWRNALGFGYRPFGSQTALLDITSIRSRRTERRRVTTRASGLARPPATIKSNVGAACETEKKARLGRPRKPRRCIHHSGKMHRAEATTTAGVARRGAAGNRAARAKSCCR